MVRDGAAANEISTDVVVIGGGLSGIASAIHLGRGGRRVILLEPQTVMAPIVGESLDWSAPGLLADLGFPTDGLIAGGAANWKNNIAVQKTDGSRRDYQPGAWLAKPPWNVETRTLHLDRQQIQLLTEAKAAQLSVRTIHERVVDFEQQDDRLVSVRTDAGRRIKASWFVDASGATSSLLGRRFKLRSYVYGPRKVALWAHVPVEQRAGGTNLYMLNPSTDYMEWLWEIPIRSGISSFGYVLPGAAMKIRRAHGMSNAEVFRSALNAFPGLKQAADSDQAFQPCSTAFLCRSFRDTCGPNWVIVGEAASQSDPITGNGVTAALRHAAEASTILLEYRDRVRIPLSSRRAYSLRVVEMGRFFNCLIENMFYQPGVRTRMDIFAVTRAYTIPAWLANLFYSRLEPRQFSGSVAFTSALASLRIASWGARYASRLLGDHVAQRGGGISSFQLDQQSDMKSSLVFLNDGGVRGRQVQRSK